MPIPKATGPAKRVVLGDIVHDKLLDAIVQGHLEPGETLNDVEIAQWAGTSKVPVREAIDRLAAIGLVPVQQGSGTFVSPLDETHVRQVIEVLWPIQVECTRLLVPVVTELQERAIISRIRRIPELTGAALFAPDGLFEYTITAIGNDRIVRLWKDLAPHLYRSWNLRPDTAPASANPELVEPFVEALRSRDGNRCAEMVSTWYENRVGDAATR